MIQIAIVTSVPSVIETLIKDSILKKAIDKKVLNLKLLNLRDYGIGKYKQIDDTPFGGGGGMVLMPEPLFDAIDDAMTWMKEKEDISVILPSPLGKKWNQAVAEKFSKKKSIILICGRYKGLDERVIKKYVTDQFSIGDFIMTSGEIPSMIFLDSIVRLVPGALNNLDSVLNDSFSHELLDYPHYTKPRDFRNTVVPSVLLGGNHKQIDKWRNDHRKKRTINYRPDLWEKYIKKKESEKNNE